MISISISNNDGSPSHEIELPETHTFKSLGVEHVIDYTLFTTEGWKHYIHYAHRFAYDGAPKVEDSENQEQLAKRFNAIEDKISKLYGDKPLVARRTGDPVAKAMKVYIVKVLAAKGTKVKDIPKLGATVEEVEESAKALKLGKAKVSRIRELAEADVAREVDALDDLTA